MDYIQYFVQVAPCVPALSTFNDHDPVRQSPISLIPNYVCFWIWDGFCTQMPELQCHKQDEQFPPFTLVLVAGSEVGMKNFPNPGRADLPLLNILL